MPQLPNHDPLTQRPITNAEIDQAWEALEELPVTLSNGMKIYAALRDEKRIVDLLNVWDMAGLSTMSFKTPAGRIPLTKAQAQGALDEMRLLRAQRALLLFEEAQTLKAAVETNGSATWRDLQNWIDSYV